MKIHKVVRYRTPINWAVTLRIQSLQISVVERNETRRKKGKGNKSDPRIYLGQFIGNENLRTEIECSAASGMMNDVKNCNSLAKEKKTRMKEEKKNKRQQRKNVYKRMIFVDVKIRYHKRYKMNVECTSVMEKEEKEKKNAFVSIPYEISCTRGTKLSTRSS